MPMKYFEFGTEHETTLLLLHGTLTTWKKSFGKFIKIAKEKYHIIAVALDGFNPDEPQVNAISVKAEAAKIADYLVRHFDGRIDIVLGESLGVMIMTELLLDPRIHVHTAIGDGYTIMEYPYIKSEIPKRIFARTIVGFERFALRHKKLFCHFLGDNVGSMLYTKASTKTLYNLEYSMMPYRYKFEALNRADSYLWHGEKEPGLKQVMKKIDRHKYHYAHKIFQKRGHGSLLKEPERLLKEIELAHSGYKGIIYSKP